MRSNIIYQLLANFSPSPSCTDAFLFALDSRTQRPWKRGRVYSYVCSCVCNKISNAFQRRSIASRWLFHYRDARMWFSRNVGTGVDAAKIELSMPSLLSKGRNETCRRTLIRVLQISRAVKHWTMRCGAARRSAMCDSARRGAARRGGSIGAYSSALPRERERERERENSNCGSRVPDGRERSIRETKCRPYTFLYVPIRRAIQLRWTSHTGICNILREQSSSRDRQCMRSHGSQWHLHLYWHGAQWDLEQRRMLKCICDRGLTTGPGIFPAPDRRADAREMVRARTARPATDAETRIQCD